MHFLCWGQRKSNRSVDGVQTLTLKLTKVRVIRWTRRTKREPQDENQSKIRGLYADRIGDCVCDESQRALPRRFASPGVAALRIIQVVVVAARYLRRDRFAVCAVSVF